MLPNHHFVISAFIIGIVSIILFPEMGLGKIGLWIFMGGFISAAIDLDVIALVMLKSKKEKRLKPFKDPREIFRNFNGFMDILAITGVLRTALATHIIFSSVIILVFYLGANQFFIPVTIGVISHLLSDIPNLKRVI